MDSVAECKYLVLTANGTLRLKKIHTYYYQVMGQLGLCGAGWCDFFVWRKKEHHYEMIVSDNEMKVKLDTFFFQFYMNKSK